MITFQPQRRGAPRPTPVRATLPTFDRLEDRILLYSTIGGEWSYPVRITYSFVSDGTSIGGTPSNLLMRQMPSGWQTAIQKAAAVWEAAANINLVQVADNGAPIGSSGNQQGDPSFGDIRICGMATAAQPLAFAFCPHHSTAGPTPATSASTPPSGGRPTARPTTWRRSRSTSSATRWGSANPTPPTPSSRTPTPTCTRTTTTTKQALTSDDIAGIQSIYGAPQRDSFDAAAGNTSSSTAADLTPYINSSNGQGALANLDIYHQYERQLVQGDRPRLDHGDDGRDDAVEQSQLAHPQGHGLRREPAKRGQVDRLATMVTRSASPSRASQPGQIWYIKVMAGTSGAGSIGAYGLLVNFGSSSQSAIAPPYTVVAGKARSGSDDDPEGTGWTIGGQFIPYPGISGSLLLGSTGILDTGNGIDRITIGTHSGYGDALDVGPMGGHGHHPGGGVGDTQLEGHHQHGDAEFFNLSGERRRRAPLGLAVKRVGPALSSEPVVVHPERRR